MDTLGATIGSLFNVVRLFVLFDLISSGSRKNDNLWKSLGGIMVNGALGRFLEYSMESLVSILKAPLGQTLGGPSIYSLGTPLRTLGNLPRGSIHHYTPSAFPQIVPIVLNTSK